MKIEGILEKLQDAVENQLLSLNELRKVPILTYKQSDINSVLRAGIYTGVDTAIVLMPPVPGNVNPHVVGPVFNSVIIEIKVVENTTTNRCGSTLLFVAEVVMQCLHMWEPGIADENYVLELASGTQACRAECNDSTNCLIIRFVMPCHLGSM
jgi:hypothetical protein